MYYIKNAASNYYMSVKNGGISSGTRIVQASKTTSAANGLHQLWKIKYLGSGKYSFRPMHKLNLGLDCTSASSVAARNIGTTENTLSDVDSYARWSIYWVTDGYVFKSGERIGYALCSDTNTCDANVNIASYTNGLVFRWDFEGAGTVNNQVRLYDTSTESAASNPLKVVQVGETRSLNDMQLTTAFVSKNSIDQSITWSTNSTAISVNSSTGAITGLVGNRTVTVIATHIHNGVSYSKSYTVQVINNTGLTFSALDIGDSTEDEAGLFASYFSDYGYTNIGSYNNINGFIPAQKVKELGRYSDIVYINGHGGRPACLYVESYETGDDVVVEYLCADSVIDPGTNLPRVGIGAQWTNERKTTTNSYWDLRTKWAILGQCYQLAYDTGIADAQWDGTWNALWWTRVMLGEESRMHGILGYYEAAPPAAHSYDRLEKFLKEADNETILNAWQKAHTHILNVDTNWAMLYHSENADDRIDDFTDSTASGTPHTVYLMRGEAGLVKFQHVDATSNGTAASTNNVNLNSTPVFDCTLDTTAINNIYSRLEATLCHDENDSLIIDNNQKIVYTNSDSRLGEADLGFTLSDDDAVDTALQMLGELNLKPDGDYRAQVSVSKRYKVDLIENQLSAPETVGYTVAFYRTYNGLDVLSDEEDGIVVSFDKYGLKSLNYKWRDITVVEASRPMSTNAISMDQAKSMYVSAMNLSAQASTTAFNTDNVVDPVIRMAYLQIDGEMRPVWVCASGYGYGNHIFIDMQTGDQIYI